MFTACEKCLTKHQLNTDSVTGPTITYRCKNCSHINKVPNPSLDGSGSGAAQQAAPQAGSPDMASSSHSDLMEVKPKISGLSIKIKITMAIVTLIVIALSSVGFIASTRGSAALSSQAENHLAQIAEQKSIEYNAIFNRLQNEIESAASYASYMFERQNITEDLNFDVIMPWTGSTYGTPELVAKYHSEILALQRVAITLHGLVKKNPYLELGYMATENNVMALDDEEVVKVIEAVDGYVPKKRPWYIDAASKGSTVWTQPYVDVNTKKLIVSCAAPVYGSRKNLIGVVGFDVLLETIQKDIIALDIGYNSHAFLMDREGNLLAKPGMDSANTSWNQTMKTDNALETDNLEFKAIIKKMIAGDIGVGKHKEGKEISYVAYAPLPAIDASVGIAVSQSEVMKPAVDIQKIIIGVWIVVVIISIIIGLIIGNGITKPINNLTMRADLISQGKVDLEEISTNRKDEIGVLIEAFNRLVTSLRIAMSRRRR